MIGDEVFDVRVTVVAQRGRGNTATVHELNLRWPNLQRRREVAEALAQVEKLVAALPLEAGNGLD